MELGEEQVFIFSGKAMQGNNQEKYINWQEKACLGYYWTAEAIQKQGRSGYIHSVGPCCVVLKE